MVILATKCYVDGEARHRALDGMNSLVDNAVGDLAVEYDVGVRNDEFVAVTLSGPDEIAGRNLLREQWGEVTPHFEAGETYVGTLEGWTDDGWVLDAGEAVHVARDDLGLGPGDPGQLRERFGVVQHTPLSFVAGDEPALADAARDRLYDWTRGEGRVNVNSATRGEVRATVNRAGHARDIVTVERLGLSEQSIVCRADTDPPGLLAAVGAHLPAELKAVVP